MESHSGSAVSKLWDYYTLTKPEVNLLILMTTSAGYYLGSRGPLGVGQACHYAGRHVAGCQWDCNSQSVDGEGP
jgi:heme O synthase-like polyprenyltransferase